LLRSGKIYWVQLYTKLGDQIGFTLGLSMKKEPYLAQLRMSSQRSWGISSATELKYKLSEELGNELSSGAII